jgi:hypothetical protein
MDDLIKMMAIEKLCSILECKGDTSYKYLVKQNKLGHDSKENHIEENIITEQFNNLQKEVNLIKEKETNFIKEVTTLIASNNVVLNGVESFVNCMQTQVTDVQTQVTDVQTQVTDVQTQVTDVQTQVTDVQTQVTDVKNEIAESIKNLNSIVESQIDAVFKEIKLINNDAQTQLNKSDYLELSKDVNQLKLEMIRFEKYNNEQILPLIESKLTNVVSCDNFTESNNDMLGKIHALSERVCKFENYLDEHIFRLDERISQLCQRFILIDDQITLVNQKVTKLQIDQMSSKLMDERRMDALEQKYADLEKLLTTERQNVVLVVEEKKQEDLVCVNEENSVDEELSYSESEPEVGTDDEIDTDTEELKKQSQHQQELSTNKDEQKEVEEENEHKTEEEEEEESSGDEVFEIEIEDVTYFATDEDNGILYEMTSDGDVGKKVGIIKNGEPIFN